MRKSRLARTFPPIFEWTWLPAFVLSLGFISSCDKGQPRSLPETPMPVQRPQASESPPPPQVQDTSVVIPETLAVEPRLKKVQQRIRVDTLAWLGQEWKWTVHASGRNDWVPIRISGTEEMRFQNGALTFRPVKTGAEDFHWKLLSPQAAPWKAADSANGIPLRFKLQVVNPVQLEWAPFTETVLVGQSMEVTLHAKRDARFAGVTRLTVLAPGATVPETAWVWNAPSIRLRRTLVHAGTHSWKAMAWNEAMAVDSSKLEIPVLSPISVSFTAPKDTLEPGTAFHFQVGKPEGNGPFQMELDADQDGKVDWSGSGEGKIPWKANRSGHFAARLKLTDSKGLTSWTEAMWIVNQKIKVKAAAKSMKCNLITPFQLKLEFQDSDDSLQKWFAVFPDRNANGNAIADTVALRASEAFSPHGGKGYAEKKWSTPGLYPVELCAMSRDGRQACNKLNLEVFNAKPTCKINGKVQPMPGIPISLLGEAEDPDGTLVQFEWDLDGDGRYEWQREKNEPVPFTFSRKGKFPIAFRVTTADRMIARDSILMVVKSSW
jgi:hypothetical protein